MEIWNDHHHWQFSEGFAKYGSALLLPYRGVNRGASTGCNLPGGHFSSLSEGEIELDLWSTVPAPISKVQAHLRGLQPLQIIKCDWYIQPVLKCSSKWLFLKYLMQCSIPHSSWEQPNDRSKCWGGNSPSQSRSHPWLAAHPAPLPAGRTCLHPPAPPQPAESPGAHSALCCGEKITLLPHFRQHFLKRKQL